MLNDCDDKTTLPNYLKDLYSREPQQVDSLLSTLINPYDSKNSLDVEKCLWVICGGQKPEDFTRIIKSNDRSVICGLVWDANFIAYRCKTCGITPCMSLCAECFENGDHEGHDFNMFKSGAGLSTLTVQFVSFCKIYVRIYRSRSYFCLSSIDCLQQQI